MLQYRKCVVFQYKWINKSQKKRYFISVMQLGHFDLKGLFMYLNPNRISGNSMCHFLVGNNLHNDEVREKEVSTR